MKISTLKALKHAQVCHLLMLGAFRMILAITVAIWVTLHTAIGALLRPENQRLAYRVARQVVGCRAVCRAVNVHVVFLKPHTPIQSGTLVVCNHFTAMDPIILGSQLPVCFVGKGAINRWPVVGWVCRTHGMLLVERSRRRTFHTLGEQIRQRLGKGVSILVFAEGTTGDGESLLPFKSGSFASVAGINGGCVLPAFLNATAINGLPVQGAQGRKALSHNLHPGLFRHLLHLFGHARLDFSIRNGPELASATCDRKELARAAFEQVEQLAINTTQEL